MPDDDVRFLTAAVVADTGRLRVARAAAARLAASDHPGLSQRVEGEINDDFLGLHLALVMGGAERVRAERAMIASLGARSATADPVAA